MKISYVQCGISFFFFFVNSCALIGKYLKYFMTFPLSNTELKKKIFDSLYAVKYLSGSRAITEFRGNSDS